MDTNKNFPADVVLLGVYTHQQAALIQKELNKNGIPTELHYPENKEALPEWLATSVYIHSEHGKDALKICKELGLPADLKIQESSSGGWLIPFLIIVLTAVAVYVYYTYFFKK